MQKRQPTSQELASGLAALEVMEDTKIDLSDIPEQLDWSKAIVGKYYSPIKEPVSLRIDSYVLDWFKAGGGGY